MKRWLRHQLIFKVEAIHRRAQTGSGRPPMVEAVAPDGSRVQAYLKSPSLNAKKSSKCLEREWMSAGLAKALSLPCARPVKLLLPRILVESLDDENLCRQLLSGPEVLFGSARAPNGFALWSQATSLPAHMHTTAARAYVFDTVVQNWDRSIANPNLLTDGSALFLFDHDETFAKVTSEPDEASAAKPPWQLGAIDNHYEGTAQHVLWRTARKVSSEAFQAIGNAWKELANETYYSLANAMPDCWDRDAGLAIAGYLVEARDNIDSVIENIINNSRK